MARAYLSPKIQQFVKNYIQKNIPYDELKLWASHEKLSKVNPTYIGLLGEIAVMALLKQNIKKNFKEKPVKRADDGFDVVIHNVNYDIKTMTSDYLPNNKFRYNVPHKHVCKENNDGFIFVTLYQDFEKKDLTAFVPGFISQNEFMKKATFHRRGEQSTLKNGFVYRCDTWDISRSHLIDFSKIKEISKNM